jgi:hypothetical protein
MTNSALTALVVVLAMQTAPRMQSLIAVVRPVLPFPGATADGDLPADNSAASKWFVLWPAAADDTRITVRANPLHPDVQKASADAMGEINKAVAAAERRAQAAYDRALEQLRKGGKTGELEPVTLDDEGVAGQRIDAELEATIELDSAASFEIDSGEAPTVAPAATAGVWVVSVPANTYRSGDSKERREQFRAAESRLFFGLSSRPDATKLGNRPRYRVTVPQSITAFCVVIRGNAELVAELTASADWAQLAAR